MLDPEKKKLWVDALRSHKFKQGTQYLCRNGEHCAIGVYEEITGNLEWDSIGVKRTKDTKSICISGHGLRATVGERLEELLQLNDDKKVSFSEIADWIEQNL